ncbi:MAG: thioredoxin family protein [Alphaproteobacteria bacterium]|nr:thioredoxin family protein [Alphaproteobacteria bacterium]
MLPVGLGALGLLPQSAAGEGELPLNDDGLHTQPWFHTSFLDLKEDAQEAHDAGKSFVILWEQRGCPYCRELHRINLADKELSGYIQQNFVVLQLNLYGARTVTDFDGKEMEERELARRWRVNFTPTISYFAGDPEKYAAKDGGALEAWRLIGYWKPFHFKSSFVYVETGGYASEPNFQKWLTERREALKAKGEKVDIW